MQYKYLQNVTNGLPSLNGIGVFISLIRSVSNSVPENKTNVKIQKLTFLYFIQPYYIYSKFYLFQNL